MAISKECERMLHKMGYLQKQFIFEWRGYWEGTENHLSAHRCKNCESHFMNFIRKMRVSVNLVEII